MSADLPDGVEEVRVLRIQPGDVVVATVQDAENMDFDRIISELTRLWPNNECLVLCGVDLSVGRAP